MPRHLIHIGFPKAGSATLQSWFSDHPELVYAPTGLAGHRDADDLAFRAASGDERLIVLPYELLRDDPHAFVAALEQRLGVTLSGGLPPRLNPSLSGAELYWYPRLTRVVTKAAAPFGRRRAPLLASYRARIGGPDLRRGISLLARVAAGRQVLPSTLVPAETLDRCRGRAAGLSGLPHYERYAAEYLNDAG